MSAAELHAPSNRGMGRDDAAYVAQVVEESRQVAQELGLNCPVLVEAVGDGKPLGERVFPQHKFLILYSLMLVFVAEAGEFELGSTAHNFFEIRSSLYVLFTV
jgi:hypothetical protein